MISRRTASSFGAAAALAALLGASSLLTGCGLNAGSANSAATAATGQARFGGNVHGGQQAVTGATVKLWAAGTGAAYGTGATQVASTTSDANGNFTFDNLLGVSPCTTGQYLYVTAQGGNSGSGTNASLAEMSAIPTPCSSTTGSLFVTVNEETTVASVFALAQFMTITPGNATPWQVGAPATNITGMANAFLMSNQLVNFATGFSANSSTSNTTNTVTVAGTYVTTVNPDFTKINTMADILAYCVNTAGGTNCNSLFTDTTPSGGTKPTDTIDVAYNLATNAGGLNLPNGTNAQGSPYYLCSTYVSATAPFQPTLPCTTTTYPTDFAINVQYKIVNPSGATVGTITAGSVAIDGLGNVWTAANNSSATGGSITAMNVTGAVVVQPVSSATISTTAGWYGIQYTGTNPLPFGGTRPYALAIDTNNNAWASAYYTAAIPIMNNSTVSGGTNEDPLIEVAQNGTATGYLVAQSAGALTIDGSNNIYMSDIPTLGPNSTTSRYYVSELQAAGAPAYSNFFTGVSRQTGIFAQLSVDQSTNQYVYPYTGTCSAAINRTNDGIEAQNTADAISTTTVPSTITLSTTAPTTCVLLGANDAKGNVWGTTATYLEYIDTVDGPATLAAPITTQFASGTGSTYGGLDTPGGVAIDGLGNVWVANTVSSTTGGVTELTPTVNSANGTATVVAKSPQQAGFYGFGSQIGYSKPIGVVLDASGNVWVETTGGSYLNVLVGLAAPVVTPYATAIKNTKVATRP